METKHTQKHIHHPTQASNSWKTKWQAEQLALCAHAEPCMCVQAECFLSHIELSYFPLPSFFHRFLSFPSFIPTFFPSRTTSPFHFSFYQQSNRFHSTKTSFSLQIKTLKQLSPRAKSLLLLLYAESVCLYI